MAHFAELDQNSIVLRVIVVPDEHEADGENWCNALLGGSWKQTSYNGNIRARYAGVGYTYDAALDVFITPQPFASWTLNPDTTEWQAPTTMPDDGQIYNWDEATLSWVVL